MSNCEICPILEQPSEQEVAMRLLEGEYWRATLRQADQSLLGTTFVTAKRHVPALSELHQDEWLEFARLNTQLERATKLAFGAQVINTACLMNLAFRNQPPTPPHVHWHLKPRYAEPVEFAGITFTDPQFGAYLDGKHTRLPVDNKVAGEIVAAIKQLLP